MNWNNKRKLRRAQVLDQYVPVILQPGETSKGTPRLDDDVPPPKPADKPKKQKMKLDD